MAAIIAVTNQKGGTGKTTTVVSVGHRLALEAHRVLIVDTDVQGHVATALGMEKAPGIYRLVQWYQGTDRNLLIVPGRANLDIIPSDKMTEPAKRILAGMDFRERILADAIAELTSQRDYDVVLIDCAPSVDVLHVAALVAADFVLIPTRLDYLAVDGVKEVVSSIAEIKRRSKSSVELLGILPTFFDRQTNETVTQLQELVRAFGNLVWPPIPMDTKLREAPAYGQTIWEYAPNSRGVTGIVNGSGKVIGGYQQAVARVREVL